LGRRCRLTLRTEIGATDCQETTVIARSKATSKELLEQSDLEFLVHSWQSPLYNPTSTDALSANSYRSAGRLPRPYGPRNDNGRTVAAASFPTPLSLRGAKRRGNLRCTILRLLILFRQIRTALPGDCHGRKRPRNDSGLLIADCTDSCAT